MVVSKGFLCFCFFFLGFSMAFLYGSKIKHETTFVIPLWKDYHQGVLGVVWGV